MLSPLGRPDDLEADARRTLERRARRLAERLPEPEGDDGVLWVAELAVGGGRYGIPIEKTRAAFPLRAVTPVPLAPPHVIGIVRFDGRVLPVWSLASLLGTAGWRVDPAVLLVVELAPDELAALDCERIPKPTSLSVARVEEARRAAGDAAVVPVLAQDQAPIGLIDVARLVEGREREGRGVR